MLTSSGKFIARRRSTCLLLVTTTMLLWPHAELPAAESRRVTDGLQVLYTFEADSRDVVRDRSGVGQPLDLKIDQRAGVRWRNGALVVRSDVRIRSNGPATKVTDAIKRSGAVTIEAWITPDNNRQTGPARIVTLSSNTVKRNFTLGQDAGQYVVRLRTTKTDSNGIPATTTPTGSAATKLTHVVYTRDATGNARVFINGKQEAAENVGGKLSSWNDKFRLSLANEHSNNRPWLGELHLVAIYSKALTEQEVGKNFSAGSAPESAATAVAAAPRPSGSRVSDGLQALYSFDAGRGDIVQDRSGTGSPLNLKIEKESAVKWQKGALVVRSATKIRSADAATKIIDGIRQTGAVSIEAWVKPDNNRQSGPARVVSVSPDTGQRNFTLGQDGEFYEVRFRTSSTGSNGTPATVTPPGTAKTRLTHIVYTREPTGTARVYIDGRLQATKQVAGDLTPWKEDFHLVLANEFTGKRPWLGELHLVAIFNRALTAAEVTKNFKAGAQGKRVSNEQLLLASHQRRFDTKIAPLLAQNCLECHDSATKKGRLDLSRKTTAMAGGESGKVIVPGKSAQSLLWEQVESGDMPPEGKPLSVAQKKLLKEWIDGGAVWSGEVIDPVIYVNNDNAAEIWVQRLTVQEYIETVRSAVGVDISKEAREILPPDLRADGFSNTAYNLNVDLKHVDAYSRLAEMIVQRMDVPAFAARFSKSRSLNTDATARKLVEAMGKWLLRGPLTKREEIVYSGIPTTVASAGGSYDEAVALIIEAMLQSPRFIYRMEDQREAGMVGDYELASRLSYILWGGPPDKELMRAADKGELSDPGQLSAQIDRMLKDPRAIARSLQFAAEWLDIGRLANMQPNAKRYPTWSRDLANDMRQETLAFFEEIVWKQRRPLADLINAQFTFATPRLAKHYGLQPQGDGLSRYDVSNVPARGGLLTQGSVLTIGGDDASMVTRGLFVLKDVLRGMVGDPPPGLDTTPVPSKPGLSQRLIAEKRIANVACGGCHSKFEPLAFGLEKFDGIGAYHEVDEHKNKLRDDGEILFPGAAQAVKYESSAELMNLLAGNARVRESITWKVAQFAVGRPLGAADAHIVRKVHDAAQDDGGTYQSLMAAIVTSDLVLMNRNTTSQE